MSNLAHYKPQVIDAEIISVELAPPEAKQALATRAWESLPLAHRTPDNLGTLRAAAATDARGFLELCRDEGLHVDFELVINYHHTENHHHTTHHHHHASNDPTTADLVAMLAAQQQQAIAMMAQQWQQPIYYPQPAPNITISPHIEVSSEAHSHSEQDNSGGGHGLFIVLALWLAMCGVALVGGK